MENKFLVNISDKACHSHVSLSFFGFLRQDVTFEWFLMCDFACTCQVKTFFCAGVCFNFWHFNIIKRLHPAGVSLR